MNKPPGVLTSADACPVRPLVRDLLDAETRAVPKILREDVYPPLGSDVDRADVYTSRQVHDLEVAKMWAKVWQMACREEDIPEVGDYIVYDIADMSFLVVRSAADRIQAFHNVCLHRGRQLKTGQGTDQHFRCPFHGFTWNLDGSLKEVPCRWDFPQVKDQEYGLPAARVGVWGGFVFINPDPAAEPLADYLQPLPEHFERWRLEDCYKAAHVAKIIHANWKVTAEAFMESLHVRETHPQIMSYTADINSQYDVFSPGGKVNRAVHPMAVPSPYRADATAQESVDDIVATSGRMDGGTEPLVVPPGMTARAFMGDVNRRIFGAMSGADLSDVTDCEVLDALVYNVFPNFAPWGGFNPNIIYRWRPNGNDPHSCLMEVMILMRYPKDQARPAPAAMHWLADDEPWTHAPELGALGDVFEQDMANLPFVQRGLRASANNRVIFARYQESRIRHFHDLMAKYLSA